MAYQEEAPDKNEKAKGETGEICRHNMKGGGGSLKPSGKGEIPGAESRFEADAAFKDSYPRYKGHEGPGV